MSSSTDLSELLSMIQFEIQKAFDFSFALSKVAAKDPNSPTLHISFESVELDVPVEISMVEKSVRPTEEKGEEKEKKEGEEKSGVEIDMEYLLSRPFNPKILSEHPMKKPQGEVKTKSIRLKVVGLEEAQAHPEGKIAIGRIKIKATPILR